MPDITVPDFSISDELRFLAVQCAAQAEGTHRDQDALFLVRMGAQLAIIGHEPTYRLIDATITDAHEAHDTNLQALIRLCSTIINNVAAHLERRDALGMGDAA